MIFIITYLLSFIVTHLFLITLILLFVIQELVAIFLDRQSNN